MEFMNALPKDLMTFLEVTLFSLMIGLSQKILHSHETTEHTFGTDRTFAFIGILGFILFRIIPGNPMLFIGGGAALIIFLGIHYTFNILRHEDHGMTSIMIALVTYCLGPLLLTQPLWFVLLIIVIVLVLTEMKVTFAQLSEKFDKSEFLTLAKFLVIAGVILPIVPNEPIIKEPVITPYKIWLAVVVVSSISYLSYLLKKFVFKRGSIILSGILGGLYSSTATTLILSRKISKDPESGNQYVAAIILATAMMYLRILLLILIFNAVLFRILYPYFIILFAVSGGTGLAILMFRKNKQLTRSVELPDDKNPLEFRVALLFAVLYVVFSFITWFVVTSFGRQGLNVLSYVVGFTDIDPFLVNLFQGKTQIPIDAIAMATLQAIIGNNLVKMLYGVFLSTKKTRLLIVGGFAVIIIVNLILIPNV